MLKIFLSILISLNSVAFQSGDNSVSSRFGSGEEVAIIHTYDLEEASGLVASIAHPDNFWAINDSGNPAKVFLIDEKANIMKSYWLDGAINYDWEDIATFTDKSNGTSKVAVADIGDNFAVRDHIRLFVFNETETMTETDPIIHHVKTLKMKYEDGPRDAEALFIDPLTSEIFIITKRERNVRVYQGSLNFSADTIPLTFQTTLPFFLVTAADISADGTEILVKTYNTIYYWQRNPSESIIQTIQKEFEVLPYIPEPQGESIAWNYDGSGYVTLSERNEPKDQIFYFYKRQ